VDYVGAGTVEFIADASEGLRADRIWFMEMNTRLQVEHPVTEAITDVDLVAWQIRVANGEPLPLTQDQIVLNGHAVEARLYAEDPTHGFLPSVGVLDHLRLPHGRVDTGFAQGDTVSPHYDPMLAKLIHHAPDRTQAIAGLRAMAAQVECWPVKTNAAFLVKALGDADVVAGKVDTGLIARRGEAWTAPAAPSQAALQTAAHKAMPAKAPGPWHDLRGLRLNRDTVPTRLRLASGDGVHEVDLAAPSPLPALPYGPGWLVSEEGQTHLITLWRPGPQGDSGGSGDIHAPMPGLVVAVAVRAGDRVAKGQALLTLEAMKMEQALVAPSPGWWRT
jgi:3-methylcrotonyl-CoA carboxylase alpha subunit